MIDTATGMDIYEINRCETFCRPRDKHGALSNFWNGPFVASGRCWGTSEALYQAMKIPGHPHIQDAIAGMRPGDGKKLIYAHKDLWRPDWLDVSLKAMEWVLRAKTLAHWGLFSNVFSPLFNRIVVEESTRDDFYGAKIVPGNERYLKGHNHLGKLWMKIIREIYDTEFKQGSALDPPAIPGAMLLGEPIVRQIIREEAKETK